MTQPAELTEQATIVIPAHNEEKSIRRLLERLRPDPAAGEPQEILVVCNGCTDATADVARAVDFPGLRVLEISDASKRLALEFGDRHAGFARRVYLDADVEIDLVDVTRLLEPLDDQLLATGPTRRFDERGVSVWVRWYYEVWERLPPVVEGLFGRGVIALSAAGHRRVTALPHLMSDDLAISEAFGPDERRILEDAVVVIRPPKKLADLLRRRVRVVTGNAQMDEEQLRSDSSRTSIGTLGAILRAKPMLAPQMVVFVGVTIAARIGARRRLRSGDFHTWNRDESSRSD